MPTIVKWVGREVPESLPGIDLLGELDTERILYGEVYPGDASALGAHERDIAYLWARQGDYKLILPQGEKPWGNYLKKDALFNLAEDPTEMQNLITDPDLAPVVARLRNAIDAWWQ